MTTYVYEQVKERRSVKGTCPVCGKITTRTQTFENTINPFNRNEDKTPRTREQVQANVKRMADDWAPDFTHEKCRKAS
jgi:hypothetical protein